MNAPHTPGPWIPVEVAEDLTFPCGVPIAIHRADEKWRKVGRICEMVGASGPDGRYSSEVTAANAGLIAAAPELLEAAKGVLDRISEVYRPEYVERAVMAEPSSLLGRVKALAAIVAKAEGAASSWRCGAEAGPANPQVPHAFTSEGDYVVACDVCGGAPRAAIHNP